MSGEMSLWEYGAIVHNWNERQPKEDGVTPEWRVNPTEEEQAEMRYQTALTVERAQSQSVH